MYLCLYAYVYIYIGMYLCTPGRIYKIDREREWGSYMIEGRERKYISLGKDWQIEREGFVNPTPNSERRMRNQSYFYNLNFTGKQIELLSYLMFNIIDYSYKKRKRWGDVFSGFILVEFFYLSRKWLYLNLFISFKSSVCGRLLLDESVCRLIFRFILFYFSFSFNFNFLFSGLIEFIRIVFPISLFSSYQTKVMFYRTKLSICWEKKIWWRWN